MKCFTMLLVLTSLIQFGGTSTAADLENYLFLAFDTETFENCREFQKGQIISVYVILWNPVNPAFGEEGFRPVENVGGFECRLTPSPDIEVVGITFPVFSIDVGSHGSNIVGYTEPVPVQGGINGRFVILATVEVILGDETVSGSQAMDPIIKSPYPTCSGDLGTLYIGEVQPFSSISGMAAYLDADDLDDPLIGADCGGGPWENCAILFAESPVSTKRETWGHLKALYR